MKKHLGRGIIYIQRYICPDGPMDKTVDSGSTDVGSIPTRDAKTQAQARHMACVFTFTQSSIKDELNECFLWRGYDRS